MSETPPDVTPPPGPVSPETALARTVTALLSLTAFCVWLSGSERSAYFGMGAAAVLLVGEVAPEYLRPVGFLWRIVGPLVRPLVAALAWLTRLVVPEPYRRPQETRKPMPWKELFGALNTAIDEEEARRKRDGEGPPKS